MTEDEIQAKILNLQAQKKTTKNYIKIKRLKTQLKRIKNVG